jgi:hypothetical protein
LANIDGYFGMSGAGYYDHSGGKGEAAQQDDRGNHRTEGAQLKFCKQMLHRVLRIFRTGRDYVQDRPDLFARSGRAFDMASSLEYTTRSRIPERLF